MFRKYLAGFVLAGLTLGSSHLAYADGFAAAATPSRFEIEAKAGEIVSKVLEIQHVSDVSTEYGLRTADWSLSDERGLEFFDQLQPGSCRPWVRLERRNIKMNAKSKRGFRFEIHVPADTTPMECRFAIMVENFEQKAVPIFKTAPLDIPVTGRLGVIVYVSVGGAVPKLELIGLNRAEKQADGHPTVTIKNTGTAHGRLDGALQAVDAKGQVFVLPVSTVPIMPGQTRALTLTPAQNMNNKKPVKVEYPVKVKGKLDWDAGNFEFDQELP